MKLTTLAIPTLEITGVHLGERRHIELPSTPTQMATASSTRPDPMDTDLFLRPVMNIELPSTSVQIKTASSTRPVQMDIDISSRPVMNSETPSTFLGMETAVSSRAVQMDTDISLGPGYFKISMPLTATENKLKDVISEVKAKLRKARNTNKKLRMQTMMAEKIMKSSAYQMVKEKMSPGTRQVIHFSQCRSSSLQRSLQGDVLL